METDVRPEVLISRLTSDNETWRVDAERRLLAMGPAAVEPLVHSLRHASPSVRVHALHALGRLKDLRALDAVIGALADTENLGAVAIAAEKALIAWGDPVKTSLIQVSVAGPSAVRPRAIRALGKIGGEDLEDILLPLLKDAEPGVRTQGALALVAALEERSIERVAPLLTDPEKWVRYEVAAALLSVGCIRGETVLREAAADPEERGTHIQFWAEDLLDSVEDLKRLGRSIA